jgi:hypothetical protein
MLVLRLRGCGIAEIARRLHRSQTYVQRSLGKGISALAQFRENV